MTNSDLKDHLLNGETIIWSGRPAQGLRPTPADWLLIPFSLMWGGFAIFWEAMVLAAPKTPLFFKLWGIPFVLIGLYLMIGRFVHDAWIRRNMQYAVTNKRILIFRAGPFTNFTAMSLDRVPEMNLAGDADGRGTIRFGPPISAGRSGSGWWTPSLNPTPQFIAIENARSVFEQIQRALQCDTSRR